MRRVYDDSKFDLAKQCITNAYKDMRFEDVSRHENYTDRVRVDLMKSFILDYFNGQFKYGHTTHAHGIGNNNAIEIIYVGDPTEEQICGLLHLTQGMYGEAYMFVTDIDGNRKEKYGELNRWGWHI